MKKRNSAYVSFFKPLMDFILAFELALLTLPLFIFTYLIMACLVKGNPIFRQERIGKNNKHFYMYKFKSLRDDAPHNMLTESFDDISKYFVKGGKFLRMSHLDELPQLYNVLFFKMSFVGPRPAIPANTGLIELRTENGVSSLTPGMTGLSQISAKDHPFSDEEKANCDKIYLEKVSLVYDVKVFFKTLSFIIYMIKGNKKRNNGGK